MLAFFRRGSGPSGMDEIVERAVAMLADARHSFDLATQALLTDIDVAAAAADIRETDQRINQTEQDLRAKLVVHVAVQGSADIGSVLGLILLLKKIERIGDQAKNILDLAEGGVRLDDDEDTAVMLAESAVISGLFDETGVLLSQDDDDIPFDDFVTRAEAVVASTQAQIEALMTSNLPGNQAVPRAIYYRYLKRIVANLVGVVRTSSEPIPHVDYLHDGTVDTDD